jgi:hypothetical protein
VHGGLWRRSHRPACFPDPWPKRLAFSVRPKAEAAWPDPLAHLVRGHHVPGTRGGATGSGSSVDRDGKVLG